MEEEVHNQDMQLRFYTQNYRDKDSEGHRSCARLHEVHNWTKVILGDLCGLLILQSTGSLYGHCPMRAWQWWVHCEQPRVQNCGEYEESIAANGWPQLEPEAMPDVDSWKWRLVSLKSKRLVLDKKNNRFMIINGQHSITTL